MRGLRTPQPGRGPARRRAAVPELPTSPDPGLRDLRADRAMRGIQGHRPAVVRPLPAVVGTLRRVRHRGPCPRRYPPGTIVRPVPQPRPWLLGALPGLQEQLATEPEALPALRPGPEDPRAPRRSGRRRPPRPGSAAPRPVRRRAARYGPGLDGPAQGARAPQRARQPDPSADQRDPRR